MGRALGGNRLGLRRSGAVLLLLLVGASLTGCNGFCATEERTAEFVGRLGDSTVAVDPGSNASGRAHLVLIQEKGRQANQKVFMGAIWATFADSIMYTRLVRGSDLARVPMLELSRFHSLPGIPDEASMNAIWDVFVAGDGMVEVVPYPPRPIVRARMKVTVAGNFASACG